ncbi:MAG: ATP-binding protein [Chloroflexi bacterium]|nr:ATP-binding protein [Chloroflexota bacterium]
MSEEILNAYEQGKRLGIVVEGSLSQGVEVKLDPEISVEDMAVGRYVTIDGKNRRFFGILTDVSLGAIDRSLSITPPDVSDPFIAKVVSGTSVYGKLHVLPMLAVAGILGIDEKPQPAKTVPPHFSTVRTASDEDIALIFGREDEHHFYVGNPLDMETKVCLNLAELVKRSNGVFGKSGTGKTFLTRILLVGMLQKNAATNLIFDMHNEYGWEGTKEGGGKVKGLKQHFSSQVAVFTLDEESSRRRGVSTDFVVEIGYDEIEPEDIEILRDTLKLTERAAQAAYRFRRRLGGSWLEKFVNEESRDEINALAKEWDEHEATIANLHRGLEGLMRLPFFKPKAREDSVRRILEYLDRGLNVVLEFGRYGDNIAAYVLVANLLSRRIHQRYRERTERSLGEGAQKPHPLVITIEEAHKFLNPAVASQTIFGTIAREMRKYNVTLLIIDQRPSGIDEEVMSQLGTKITCLLENEKDIDAVLAGVSGRSELRSVLAKLEPQQQALIFGHAVPMPVVIRTREYGSAESYRELGRGEKRGVTKDKDLWE